MPALWDREKVVLLIALMVGTAWFVVTLVSLVLHDYRDLTIITPVMAVMVGLLFEGPFRRKGRR